MNENIMGSSDIVQKIKDSIPKRITMFLSAFVSLLLCSKCSFIYPFNDWYDANILFTAGKSFLNGKILYVDLIDHKGPYTYLLYALGYLISHKTFIGIFFFEVVSLYLFLYLTDKIVKLYTEEEHLFIYPLICFAITTSSGFVHGGSMEEFAFAFLAYAIYLSLKASKNKEVKMYEILLSGIFSGILFWTKFTFCGIYAGWVIVLTIVLLKKKEIKRLFHGALVFVAGCVSSSIPWFMYFAINDSVLTFLNTYIVSNIFSYNNNAQISTVERILSIGEVAGDFYLKKGNLFLTAALAAGLIAYLFLPLKKVSLFEKAVCVFLYAITVLGVFCSGQAHGYYGLVSAAFMTIFAVSVSEAIDIAIKKKTLVKSILAVAVTFAAGIVLTFFISDNVYMLKFKKEKMPQFRFAKIIEQSEDRSLLNYRFLDGGIYTVLGTVPDIKEYCAVNLNFYGIVDKQKEYLSKGTTCFVVTWYEFPIDDAQVYEKFPEVALNYEIVESNRYFIEGDYRTYTLWRRK